MSKKATNEPATVGPEAAGPAEIDAETTTIKARAFTSSEMDKIGDIRYALSLVWALGSAHDGSFADAGNILKPIADALEDVYSARIVREVKP